MAEHTHHEAHKEHSHVRTYVVNAIVLAVLTGIEVGILFIAIPTAMRATALYGLAALKFGLVVALFMHLKYDNKLLTGFFFSGFVLAFATMISMFALMDYQPSLPPKKAAAMAQGEAAKKTHKTVAGNTVATDAVLAEGKQLFVANGCTACHKIQQIPEAVGEIGPALDGLADLAGQRVQGLGPEDYIRQSIMEPAAFLVDGYANMMPANLKDQLNEGQMKALVSFLLTLKADAAAAQQEKPASPGPDAASTDQAAAPKEEHKPMAAAAGGDAKAGGQVFVAKGCTACHATAKLPEAVGTIGPKLDGLADRAGKQVSGQSADQYIKLSVVEPGAFLVPNFQNMMPAGFKDQLSEKEMQDLMAFLKSL